MGGIRAAARGDGIECPKPPASAGRVRGAVVLATWLAASSASAVDFTVPGTTTRVEVAGHVDGLAVAPLGGPRQRPGTITEVTLLGKITRSLRTQVTLINRIGGPFEGGHPGIMNFVHEFQNRTPSLEFNEAFAELRLGDAQVRAGIQKFAWGKLDGVPPTDVLTPRDLHDPLVRDYEDSKIGIPAVQLAYNLPPVPALDLSELRATLVYIPIAVPSRLALIQERWFPPTIAVGGEIFLSQKRANRLVDNVAGSLGLNPADVEVIGPTFIPLNFHTLNHRPPTKFDDGAFAFRLTGTVRTVDWSISHYSGTETGPNAALVSTVRCPNCAGTLLLDHRLAVSARSFLRQSHSNMHMTGADGATTLGGATVRAEVAVFQDRPYLRDSADIIAQALSPPVVRRYGPTLFEKGRARVPLQALFPHRDTVEWGIGADYLIADFVPLLQLNQTIFTDHGPKQLLSNPDTRLVGSVRRRFMQETVELEVRGQYSIEREAWFVYPRASYRYGDHWRLRAGFLGIGGPRASLVGQFRDNDEFTFEARYSF